jgi:hypothetical protein
MRLFAETSSAKVWFSEFEDWLEDVMSIRK